MRIMEGNDLESILKKTVAPNNVRGHLINNEQMHDVVFILGPNEERMYAHKLFLISASPVFHNILTQGDGTILNIKINQISKNTMIEICRFAYTENVNLTQYNMFDVLHAASKFEMSFLMEKIVDFASKQVNENSVFKILENNQQHHHWQINKKCFEFIEKNHQKCLKNKSWLKVTPELMRLILQTCKLPELFAIESLKNWNQNQGDSFDDLNEMMALINLKKKDDSETESVVSETSGKPRRQRRNGKPKNNEPPKVQQTKVFNKRPQPQVPTLQQQSLITDGFFLLLEGPRIKNNYKFADLNVRAINQNIFIKELEFIYDLFASDASLEIKISTTENSKPKQIYYDSVRLVGSFKKYRLKQWCIIPKGQRAWIRVEFPRPDFRLTYGSCAVSPLSGKDLQIAPKDPNVSSYAQIIEFVYYSK